MKIFFPQRWDLIVKGKTHTEQKSYGYVGCKKVWYLLNCRIDLNIPKYIWLSLHRMICPGPQSVFNTVNREWICFLSNISARPDAMILVFWMLSLKPLFSLSSFTFIRKLFSSSLLSAIKVVSSAYLRLLVFLPAILIPACASFRLAFCMMYSAYKLNKQGDNIQPLCTPFPVWNQSLFHVQF